MQPHTTIRRLLPDDAAALMALRQQALFTDPRAFGSSPADDRLRALEFVRAGLADEHEQAVFGGFEGSQLVGMAGVIRESAAKERHKGRIWGMYVAPVARRKGTGRALLSAAIEHAGKWSGVVQLHLSVTAAAAAAKSLYESAGFRCWGCEPRAIVWEGRFVDEFHLALDLQTHGGTVCQSAM